MTGTDEHLFVYGSLREGLQHPFRRILDSGAEHLGEARFQGILYDIDWYPGAVPSDQPGDHVVGDLYRLTSPAAVLARLDAYERCAPADPPPTLFRRERVDVWRADGLRRAAWLYLYNRSVAGLRRIRSGDFLRPGPGINRQHRGVSR